MDVCRRCAFDEILDFDESFLDKAAQCGHRSFQVLAGDFDRISVKPTFYSQEDVTGVGLRDIVILPTRYGPNQEMPCHIP